MTPEQQISQLTGEVHVLALVVATYLFHLVNKDRYGGKKYFGPIEMALAIISPYFIVSWWLDSTTMTTMRAVAIGYASGAFNYYAGAKGDRMKWGLIEYGAFVVLIAIFSHDAWPLLPLAWPWILVVLVLAKAILPTILVTIGVCAIVTGLGTLAYGIAVGPIKLSAVIKKTFRLE
jgi:hypothetical protein